ncbi:MAG: AAA family ATPase [Microscillaceae bacterium]|nr:AAA family ATPase [Microscillaceae bacterium]
MLTTGKPYQPDYSPDFPAQRLQTRLDWDDLVLDYYTQRDVDEVRAWIKHREAIQQDPLFNRELTGYRALFYGPSGTGKTLTTTLLGKEMGMEVYRIDLSKVVSKYIGETEKNLAHVFNQAAYHDWILFLMKAMHFLAKEHKPKLLTTDTPIRKWPTYFSK